MKSTVNDLDKCWLRERTLYRVYIRELDRELCTRLSTLYTNT